MDEVKPTSNGETSLRQSRAELAGNIEQGVETCAQPQQMALAVKHGLEMEEGSIRANGGRLTRAELTARATVDGIVQSSERSENVLQPFRDTLIRASGYLAGSVQDTTRLFTVAGKPEGETNLPNGSTLPSDQSMVVLALRAFTWFRNSIQRDTTQIILPDGTTMLSANGDWQFPTAAQSAAFAAALNGQAIGNVNDVYRLHWQAEEQLLWSYGAGDKFSITSMPTAYFPYGGGLHGDLGGTTDLIHWNNGIPSNDNASLVAA